MLHFRIDDAQTANLITVITSTSPVASTPSLRHIYQAQQSLLKIPAFRKCQKIIVFDGVPPAYKDRVKRYEQYKLRIASLISEDTAFYKTSLVYCEDWLHLSGAIEQALSKVTTPFVFLHQHDITLVKSFDLKGCLASMIVNNNIKHIHFPRYRNLGRHSGDMQASWDGPVDSYIAGGSEIQLTRCFGWSDYAQITSVEYLQNFILPKCKHGFMETFIQPMFKKALYGLSSTQIDTVHAEYGTYLYGSLDDGNYTQHSDAARK